MNGRKALLTLIIVLFVSSCSSLEAYFENSSVVFVSPVEGLRLIDAPQVGKTVYTPLELILFSNHEEPIHLRLRNPKPAKPDPDPFYAFFLQKCIYAIGAIS